MINQNHLQPQSPSKNPKLREELEAHPSSTKSCQLPWTHWNFWSAMAPESIAFKFCWEMELEKNTLQLKEEQVDLQQSGKCLPVNISIKFSIEVELDLIPSHLWPIVEWSLLLLEVEEVDTSWWLSLKDTELLDFMVDLGIEWISWVLFWGRQCILRMEVRLRWRLKECSLWQNDNQKYLDWFIDSIVVECFFVVAGIRA